jgi:hypothetical protein
MRLGILGKNNISTTSGVVYQEELNIPEVPVFSSHFVTLAQNRYGVFHYGGFSFERLLSLSDIL